MYRRHGKAEGVERPQRARAGLVRGEVTSVAIALPGGGHFVPEAAVEVEVVAAGLAGGGVADVGVQRVPVVGELV